MPADSNHSDESLAELRHRLEELAANLFWTWHADTQEIFRDLNPTLWREKHNNPRAFLGALTDDYLYLLMPVRVP